MPNGPTRVFRRPLLIGIALLLILVATTVIMRRTALTERQALVRTQGQQVMPFDLNQTTHRFETNRTGGVQTVVAKDPTNVEQIGLIQAHLSAEIERFRTGDFADPRSIHGAMMPGLAALERGVVAIEFRYTILPGIQAIWRFLLF